MHWLGVIVAGGKRKRVEEIPTDAKYFSMLSVAAAAVALGIRWLTKREREEGEGIESSCSRATATIKIMII